MPANISPIFSLAPDIQWASAALITANAARDGASGTIATVFTADATNGGRIEKIIARSVGTNAITVLRVWVNNGSATTTAANNSLIAEMTLPATTATESAALATYEVPLSLALPAGYKIICAVSQVAAAGYYLTGIGSKY